jgi:hypothetical protein
MAVLYLLLSGATPSSQLRDDGGGDGLESDHDPAIASTTAEEAS